jgi:hypothetical protein
VFYVTDLTSKKIESETRQQAIKDRLIKILEGPLAPTTALF